MSICIIEYFNRFPRHAVRLLIDELQDLLPHPTRRDAIPAHLQVLACLNFLSGGSYQRKVGGDFLACMSQTSVSRCIRVVVEALNEIMVKWITFPKTEPEIQNIQNGFANYGIIQA